MLDIPSSVKTLLKTDGILKNFRVSFPNGEHADICNDSIIKESVQFTESLSSRDILKVGACESSILKFSCMNVENITGMTIDAQIEIDISSLSQEEQAQIGQTSQDVPFVFYAIPYGRFVVESCQRDSQMSKRNIVAYNLSENVSVGSETRVPILETKKREQLRSSATTLTLHAFNHAALMSGNAFRGFIDDRFLTKYNNYVPYSDNFISPVEFEHDGTSYHFDVDATMVSMDEEKYTLPDAAKIRYIGKGPNFSAIKQRISDWLTNGQASYYDPTQAAIEDLLYRAKCAFRIYPKEGPQGYDTYYWFNYEEGIGWETFVSDMNIVIPMSITVYLRKVYPSTIVESLTIPVYTDPSQIPFYDVNNAWMPYDYTMNVPATAVRTGNTVKYNYAESFKKANVNAVLTSAAEIMGKFGGVGRNGAFKLYDFGNFQYLFPSNSVYPADDIYPTSEANTARIERDEYISAISEETPIRYGRIIADYSYNDVDYSYRQIIDENENDYDPNTLDYDISDNVIITGNAYTDEQLTELLQPLIKVLRRIRYYKSNVSFKGMPNIESGDVVWVSTPSGVVVAPVMNRTLSGIQDLRDKVTAK